MINMYSLSELQIICHDRAVEAGWWNDIDTGEDLVDNRHVIMEKFMLAVTEVAEAVEGYRKGLMDDHLPHRPMAEVEIADTIIRLLDLSGALGYDVEGAISEKMEYNRSRPDHKIENRKKEGGKKA
jgi:NTP pyrophosphatase (non-canonical NTP hydrolase)